MFDFADISAQTGNCLGLFVDVVIDANTVETTTAAAPST